MLVIAPHPDDEVVGTCAIIKKGRELGQRFYIFFLTNGVIPREDMWFFEKKKYAIKSKYIPYGATIFKSPNESTLSEFKLIPFKYDLLIARIEPENNINTIITRIVTMT